MKKILICINTLETGGIETSLVNLLKILSTEKCDITLLMQQKVGALLKFLPKNVRIKEYKISNNKNILLRKISNRIKIIVYCLKNKNKYDTSVCYATYDYPSSIIARYLSKKSILWVHTDYKNIYKNIDTYKHFFDKRKASFFNKIVFVSNEAKNNFIKLYPTLSKKSLVVNNILNPSTILGKATKEKIDKPKKPLIVFIGRLEEESKGLFLLLDVSKQLKDYEFWLVGDGKNKEEYAEYIKNNNLTNVKLLGNKLNPYPYVQAADIFILPSIYEGFPVVTLEALVLNKKIITTIDVSANDFKLSDYTYLVKRNLKDIVNLIPKVHKTKETKKFDIINYNASNINLTKEIILGDENEI